MLDGFVGWWSQNRSNKYQREMLNYKGGGEISRRKVFSQFPVVYTTHIYANKYIYIQRHIQTQAYTDARTDTYT